MAQEVQIVLWCDKHQRLKKEKVRGKTYRIGVNGKWYEVEACAECGVPLEETTEFLKEFGRLYDPAKTAREAVEWEVRKGRTPKDGRVFQCIWCPVDYATPQVFNKHIQEKHGFKDPAEAWGPTCPICNESDFQQLGIHGRHHPEGVFTNPSQLFVWARDNGDPYGVYAERIKHGKNVRTV